MIIALLLVALLGSLGVVAFVLLWPKPKATHDLCEDCGQPATHELVGEITSHASLGGHSAMVATYCRRHAPSGAVRV